MTYKSKNEISAIIHPRQKWRFAIECVKRSLRAKRGAINAFNMPSLEQSAKENKFKPMFLQYI